MLALPMTTASDALPIAQRILDAVASIRLKTRGSAAATTISAGIAEMRLVPTPEGIEDTDTIESLLSRADDAMYAAKAAGPNRICSAWASA